MIALYLACEIDGKSLKSDAEYADVLYMSENCYPEIVINATQVTEKLSAPGYEFILNEAMEVTACGFVESLSHGVISPIKDYSYELHGVLFELNHVRVNPKLDNSAILARLAFELEKSGVYIYNPPSIDLLAMCFKPLGELSDTVRFHMQGGNELIFLSSQVKLQVVR